MSFAWLRLRHGLEAFARPRAQRARLEWVRLLLATVNFSILLTR